MIFQLTTPIEVHTPLGKGKAIAWIDYSIDVNTVWKVVLDGGMVRNFLDTDIVVIGNKMNHEKTVINFDMPKKMQYTKEKFEIADNLYADYEFDALFSNRREEFHGSHIIDESEVTDFRITALYVMVEDEFIKIDMKRIKPENIKKIENLLNFTI